MSDIDKATILAYIAEEWNKAGIVYAVGHGVEEYPHRVGRDIDVYLNRNQALLASKIARRILEEHNYVVACPGRDPWGKVSVYGFGIDDEIEIDLVFEGFAWGPVQFIREIRPSHNIGPFKVDPWVSFVKRVLTRVLLGHPPKDVWLFPWEEQIAKEECTKFFGKELTEALLVALNERDSDKIASLAPRLRRAVVLRAFLHQPLSAVKESFRWIVREIRPYLVSTAPVVAILGPEDTEKDEILQHIQFENSFLFAPVIRRYRIHIWKGKDPFFRIWRRMDRVGHWLLLIYVFLDSRLGRFRDNWITNTNRSVIYNGHLLDAYVDPRLYGFFSNRGIRTLWRKWLKPNLSIVLLKSPKHNETRNPGLDSRNLQEQIKQWKQLKESGDVDVILEINVNASPEEVAKQIEQLIKEAFIRKHAPAQEPQKGRTVAGKQPDIDSYSRGLWVAILGPDGAGKSTLIQGLQKELAGAFRRTATFHLMPRILRRGGDGGPVTDPHDKPPRSLPASLLKLAYYWLDYTLGYWLKVRPALVRSTFVLFDRYYDDILVDPKRYRYGGPMGLARWLRRFIPRPDVFVVLDVPVEKLLERKQEVPREELERQVEAYRRFALSTPNAFLLDGGQKPEEVVRQARDVLLKVLHKRYLERRTLF